jgi:parallel beta-helix repeat protein
MFGIRERHVGLLLALTALVTAEGLGSASFASGATLTATPNSPLTSTPPPPGLTPWNYVPSSCTGVAVSPGDDLQSLIDTNPEGTTFCFSPGIYRLTDRLSARSDDVFIGLPTATGGPGADLNGSKVIPTTGWIKSGSFWYATGQTQNVIEPDPDGTRCEGTYTGCLDDDDLYRDNTNLWQVTSMADLTPGTFYFDHTADTIWIADDPTGHLLEATIAPKAITGCYKYCPATGWQLRGFLIEKFSTPAQDTAVTGNSQVRIGGNEVRFVHGGGIGAGGSGTQVIHNYVHDIGQLCVSGPGSTEAVFQSNEIARCNTEGYHSGWEAGGSKFAATTNLTFDGNYVHDNGYNRVGGSGGGFWEDGNNIGAVISNNWIANNDSDGITLEISYDTTVYGNTVTGNGLTCTTGCWGAGILVENTQNVTAFNNVLDNNRRGFVVAMDDRGTGMYGLWEINNDYFHDNVVKQPNGNWTGFKYCTLSNGCSTYFSLSHARWESNAYCFASPSSAQLGWNGQDLIPSEWQDVGQDQQGHFEVCGP